MKITVTNWWILISFFGKYIFGIFFAFQKLNSVNWQIIFVRTKCDLPVKIYKMFVYKYTKTIDYIKR